jgi:hypothetical protein
MATTLALAMRASMSAAGVTAGAQQAASALDKVGNAAKKTARDVSVLKTIEIGKLIGSGVSQLANAFTDAARSAVSYARSVANAVDATQDLANRTGIGVEALQSLQVAAKLGGVDDVTVSMDKLSVSIGKAAESGKTEAFTNLGLDFNQLLMMSPEEQFRAIAASISALPTEAERAAAAVAIFGKSGAQLVPFLATLGEVEERAKRLGIVLSEQQVGSIAGMNDALDLVSKTFDGIIGQVTANLAPAITSIAEEFLAFVESFNGTGGGALADAITEALFAGADGLAAVFDSLAEGFNSWMASMGGFEGTLKTTGDIFATTSNVLVSVSETLRAAFNLFQMAGDSMALYLGKFIESLGKVLRSKTAEEFGRDMARSAQQNLNQNAKEAAGAAQNAVAAGSAVIFGGDAAPAAGASGVGMAGRAVGAARAAYENRNSPEAMADRARREAERAEGRKASEERFRQERDAEARKKAQESQDSLDKAAGKAAEFKGENAALLGTKSKEALQANDIRSSEGIGQFMALATGRDDPALVEYRKQTSTLMQLLAEQRAQRLENATILGGAAA